jgi:hypothetical protein
MAPGSGRDHCGYLRMFVSDAFDRFTELILVITIFGGTMCNLESLGFGVACGSDAASRQASHPSGGSALRRPCNGARDC